MENLTELVRHYKKNKDKKLLDKIFNDLSHTLMERAKFIFYKQDFFGKKSIKLCNTKQTELSDVIQDLNLFILKLIKNYDVKQPFENYLFYSLKLYKPSFLNKEFTKTLKTQSIFRVNDEGEEENIVEDKPVMEQNNIEFEVELTDIERKVFDLMKADLNITQDEIATELGISQQSVSLIIASIRDKIQK